MIGIRSPGTMIFTRNSDVSKKIAIAVEHQYAGRLSQAEAICRTVLAVDPQNFDALHLLGVIRHQVGQHAEAVDLIHLALLREPLDPKAQHNLGDAYFALDDMAQARSCYERAIALNSNQFETHNSLGVIFAREQRPRDAADCFMRANALKPDWSVPHFNLGLSHKELREMTPALKEFHRAWLLDPNMSSAMHECVATAAHLARSGSVHFGGTVTRGEVKPRSFSIIYCSVDDAKCRAVTNLYHRLFAGLRYELVAIRDARSLAEAYNRGIESSSGDIVLLSHDDIDVLTPDFALRLQSHLSRFDVVGVMGATDLSGPAWSWSRHPYLRGWITHHEPGEDDWDAAVVDPRPIAGDCVVLDGVLMAANRAVFDEIQFDDETFDGFHLYDTDWSFRAYQAGCNIATAGELLVVHASRGRYDATWARYASDFCDKHGLAGMPPPPPAQLIEARFRNAQEVRAFFGILADLDG